MPDTYTTTLGAILMAIGGDNNTWGTNLNNSVIQILEDAIANALPNATGTVTGGTLDLSTSAPPAGPSAARYAFLPFTGTLASNQIVKVPNLTKSWLVRNGTSGAFTLSIETPSGTPQTIPQNGGWQLVTCDGANNIAVWPFNTAQIAMPNGAAAAPAFSFLNETGSGWYPNGTQDIRFAIAGADVLQVTGPSASSPSLVNLVSPESLAVAGSSAGVFTTGDVKLTFKTVADAGWVLMNDSTIGDPSSNATYANANASALFQLLYANISDADAPILTGGGAATTRGAQGSAAAAFASHCRLTLPLVLGRALAAAGGGSGLTARTLGHALGEETHTLSTGETPAHTHGYGGTTGGESATHTHQIQQSSTATFGAGSFAGASQPTTVNTSTESQGHTHNYSGTTDSGGLGGGAHNNMQPTTFLNVMIKL